MYTTLQGKQQHKRSDYLGHSCFIYRFTDFFTVTSNIGGGNKSFTVVKHQRGEKKDKRDGEKRFDQHLLFFISLYGLLQ